MTSRIFVQLDGNLRQRIEALAESLIDILEQLDGDDDAEDDEDDETEIDDEF